MHRVAWLVLITLLLVAPALGQEALFTIVPDSEVPRSDKATIEIFGKANSATSAQVVRVNTKLLNPDGKGQKDLAFNAFSKSYTISFRRSEVRTKNDFTWFGEVTGQSGSVTLVVNKGLVTGSAVIGNEMFAIEPLKSRLHLVVQRNPAMFPPDEPQSFNKTEKRVSKFKRAKGVDSGKIIRVLVAYTKAVAAQHGDIKSFVQLAIGETNTSYLNSGIQTTLQLAYAYRVSYKESGSFDTDLSNFMGAKDKYMNEVHGLRNKYFADVLILLVDNKAYCGLAANILADAKSAFGAVRHTCAVGNYSFGHEIGHLQGARHNPEADPTTSPFAYGHGYLYPSGGWRTVMSPPVDQADYKRLQYWSNPLKTYEGTPMGTTMTSDNARVLNETAIVVANFRNRVTEMVPWAPCGMHSPIYHPERFCQNKNWVFVDHWWTHKKRTCGRLKLETRHHLHVRCLVPN